MAISGPQFATVTFLFDSGVAGATFRVPITDETSVRRLAKDAMQRLLSRRGDGLQHFTPENISVSEVFVDGGTQRAEIFPQDLVSQVVLVKEEVVFMQLRVKTSAAPAKPNPSTAHSAETVGESGAVPEALPPSDKDLVAKGAESPRTRSQSPSALTVAERSPNAIRARPDRYDDANDKNNKSKNSDNNDGVEAKQRGVAEPSLESDRAKRQAAKRSREEAERKINEDVVENVGRSISTRTSSRGLVWGPDAHKMFPQNYMASPNKLMRRCAPKAKVSEVSKHAVGVVENAGEPKPEEKPTEEKVLRPGWGPEADKYFAGNYVSSPDRLARMLRKLRREADDTKKKPHAAEATKPKEEQEKERPKQSTSESAPRSGGESRATPATEPAAPASRAPHEHSPRRAEVERRLSYDATDDARTPEGQSSRELAGGDTRPAGWGREAVRFFDPDTYCDNPSKARLSSALLQRPVRARREVVLPSYFAVLDK